jgi:hypothetical protein
MSSIVTLVRPKGGGFIGNGCVGDAFLPEQIPLRARAYLNFAGRLPRDPVKSIGVHDRIVR